MTMKILEVLKEEEEVEKLSPEELSKKIWWETRSMDTDSVLSMNIPNVEGSTLTAEISITISEDQLKSSQVSPREYQISLVEILRPHLETIRDIIKGQEVEFFINTKRFSTEIGGSILTLDVFMDPATRNQLEHYDASIDEILMGTLPFYTPTLNNVPMYDEKVEGYVNKLKQKVDKVLKVYSTGVYDGTPYTVEVVGVSFYLNNVEVKSHGNILPQDIEPYILIKVTPPELFDVIQDRLQHILGGTTFKQTEY